MLRTLIHHPVAHALALALLLTGPVSPAFARASDASSAGGVSAQQIDEIIVEARSVESTLPIQLARYGADVEFVTRDQIENYGFVDATQALGMLVPGVFLTTQAGAFSYVDLSLQGSRSSDVLWTVDGVRINNRLYNSTSPADTLPSSMIERIEVLKGGEGLLYGTQAVAGVINIVTRGFSEQPEGAISVGVDANHGHHLNGFVSGSLGKHKFVAWASQDVTDGYEIYDRYQPGAKNRKRGYDVNSFGLKYGYDFTEHLRLTVRAVHTQAALDYPNTSGGNVNDRTEDIISARLDFTPSDTAQFFVKSYYHDWDTLYYTPPEPADPPYWGYEDFGFGAGAQLRPQNGPVEYLVGVDFQRYHGRDEVLRIAGKTEEVRAVYAQIRTSDNLSKKTRLAAGVRYNETAGSSATVGSVSAEHHFNDYFYIEGVLGASFLLPDAYSLYNLDTCCAYGNPNLAPEESVSLNVSIGGRLDIGERPLSWQLTGWDRKIDNLISSTSIDNSPIAVPAGYSRVRINVDNEVKATGAEFLLRGPITQAVSFSINFSYSKEVEAGTNRQIPGRPRRNQKASLSYAPEGRRFGVDFAIKHVGKTTTDVTGFEDQQYGDYYVANLGAHVYLDHDHHQRLNFRLENAFNSTYATSVRSMALDTTGVRVLYHRLGSPRTAYLSYSYTF